MPGDAIRAREFTPMSRPLPSPGEGDRPSDLVPHHTTMQHCPSAHMSVAAQHELPHPRIFHFHDSQISHA
jgi:hypothetical protein